VGGAHAGDWIPLSTLLNALSGRQERANAVNSINILVRFTGYALMTTTSWPSVDTRPVDHADDFCTVRFGRDAVIRIGVRFAEAGARVRLSSIIFSTDLLWDGLAR
jgi:hypothetical protein